MTERDGQRDFDFWFGSWKIHNRRLRERLKGSTAWDEFEGTVTVRPVWGGKANVDEYIADGPSGRIEGMSIRLYDSKTRQWSIYWANSRSGVLDTPMIGEFQDGRGEFYNQETHGGRSVYARFLWSDITPTSARWEQALSADGGKTWETNWVMEARRAE